MAAGLLTRWKVQLIDILSADPELVLQHAHARGLLTDRGYNRVRPQLVSTDKVTLLLDLVYDRGSEAAQGLLELLRSDTFQESLPRLSFLKDLDEDLHRPTEETRRSSPEEEGRAAGPRNQGLRRPGQRRRRTAPSRPDPRVTDKQLMTVAGALGGAWKDAGIRLLDVEREKLDDIEASEGTHKMRVFSMLRVWSCRQKGRGTAARLHDLLRDPDLAVAPERLACLLEES